MWKIVLLLLGSISLVACSSATRTTEHPGNREAVCRTISRNLNLNRTESLGIGHTPLTEQGHLMQEYQQNHCEDFEGN